MNSFRFFTAKALLISGGLLVIAPAALAQNSVSSKALEKTRFYNAPRQIDIVDDRPVVRDFREGPEAAGQLALPDGPGGVAGGLGPGGIGNLGGGAGTNATIPGGGLHLPGNGSAPGYRTPHSGLASLPKSGFGANGSNIPARGLGPRGILPGVTMGVVGKMVNQNKPVAQSVGPARGMSVRGPSGGGKPSGGPSVASYGGYGNNPTSYGNSNRTEQKVRGYLLNH